MNPSIRDIIRLQTKFIESVKPTANPSAIDLFEAVIMKARNTRRSFQLVFLQLGKSWNRVADNFDFTTQLSYTAIHF